jgi:hypothetical protein
MLLEFKDWELLFINQIKDLVEGDICTLPILHIRQGFILILHFVVHIFDIVMAVPLGILILHFVIVDLILSILRSIH